MPSLPTAPIATGFLRAWLYLSLKKVLKGEEMQLFYFTCWEAGPRRINLEFWSHYGAAWLGRKQTVGMNPGMEHAGVDPHVFGHQHIVKLFIGWPCWIIRCQGHSINVESVTVPVAALRGQQSGQSQNETLQPRDFSWTITVSCL